MPLAKQGQGEVKNEVQEVSPSQQIEKSCPFMPKIKKIKNMLKRRKNVIRRVIPFPSVLEPIPKEEEEEDYEDEEDILPLN